MRILHRMFGPALWKQALIGAALLALAPATAWTQETYPNRTITIVVPFPPGGGVDSLGRLLATQLSTQMGVPVVVENQPGATATIGTRRVMQAKPDGYTLLHATTGSIVLAPNTGTATYDPRKELDAISLLARVGSILVVPANSRFKSLADMLAEAKAKPESIKYATTGVGSPQHLAGLLIDKFAGTKMVAVPYPGAGPAMAAVLGGHVDAFLTSPETVLSQVSAGTLRVFGISTKNRLSSYPDMPTIAEQGLPGYEASNWFSMFAPHGTPQPIINKLYEEIRIAMKAAPIQEFLKNAGSDPTVSTPAELQKVVVDELASYAEILKGLKF